MESTIRIFSDFKEYNSNALYSNLEEKIRYDIAKAIKAERMFQDLQHGITMELFAGTMN